MDGGCQAGEVWKHFAMYVEDSVMNFPEIENELLLSLLFYCFIVM